MISKFTLVFSVFTFFIVKTASASSDVFLPTTQNYLLQYKGNPNPLALTLSSAQLAKLKSDPRIDFIEPNFTYQISAIPNDYYYSNQWYLKRIRADKAWTSFHDSPNIVVAVIDTGVQINHPDLKDNIWVNKKEIPSNGRDDDRNGFVDDVNGWDFVNNTADPNPKFKLGYTADGVVHGTVVAGVLAASGNNRFGITGITWRAQIMPLKALDDRGVTDTVKVVNAIDYAISHKVNIINLSFIGPNYSRSLEDAVRRAYQAGIVVVAAGGNDLGKGFGQSLTDRPMYPVCLDGNNGENMVIGVAATDAVDKKTNFSGFGNCIDIAAPGISIFSTTVYSPKHNKSGSEFDSLYDGYWSGTSLAVPMVSGALALLQEAAPHLTPRELTDLLLSSTDKTNLINDSYADKLGAGRLNLYSAINNALALSRPSYQLLLSDKKAVLHGLTLSGLSAKLAKLNLVADKWQVVGSGTNFVVSAKNKIKIFDSSGTLLKEWSAFDDARVSSLSLAAANVNDDKDLEIIVASNSKGQAPEVKVFNQQGKLLNKFLAYHDSFRGGVNLATGDLDSTGRAQIVTIPASSGSAHVRIFTGTGKLVSQFMAEAPNLRGNFQVAVSDLYSSLKPEGRIIFYYNDGSSPYLKIFSRTGELRRRFAVSDAKRLDNILVTVADLDGDSRIEIACLVSDSNGSRLMLHRDNGILFKTLTIDNKLINNINNLGAIQSSH